MISWRVRVRWLLGCRIVARGESAGGGWYQWQVVYAVGDRLAGGSGTGGDIDVQMSVTLWSAG